MEAAKKVLNHDQIFVKLPIPHKCIPSLVAQLVKNLPVMQETWVRFLAWEDPLQKEMATHSSVLAWRIAGMAEPGGLPSRHD